MCLISSYAKRGGQGAGIGFKSGVAYRYNSANESSDFRNEKNLKEARLFKNIVWGFGLVHAPPLAK